MRIKFIGPEGAKFVGRELRGITPDKGQVRDLADIQMATGWKVPELNHNVSTFEMVGLHAVLFLTLRNAGFFVSWDEAGKLTEADIEVDQELGDQPAEDAKAGDPTTARTGSVPGAGNGTTPAEPTPAHRKGESRGSKSRSVPAS